MKPLLESREIAALVLAAGRARRFGADKRLVLLENEGQVQPLIVHALRPWFAVFAKVAVVLRPDDGEVRRVLVDAFADRVQCVECLRADEGMGHSLAAGVAATAEARGWVVGLADMPWVPTTAIAGVRDALMSGAALAAAYRAARRGHPVGFSDRYRQELMDSTGDVGARLFFQRDAEHVVRVAIDDEGIFADVDTPQDLIFSRSTS
ncbi:nucleotidyltransferase family protein [Tepidiphilus margaritifer]|uniref:nucleotidyltransferase family protein n=1 Tax=Tepidiphilus margaritifer TaxID=203471 RepID=UPI0004050741|nr:nucleotidyltransferase family protein [Tepidiphilus margaritifer]